MQFVKTNIEIHSLGIPLCLLYKPRTVAAAALLLATNFSTSDKLNENWFKKLDDLDIGQVYGIYKQIYTTKNMILIKDMYRTGC